MNKIPRHTLMNQFPVVAGELYVGGIPITRLAKRAGQTPFYAYDRQLILERVKQLRSAFPAEIKIHYAVKANPMPAIVQFLAGLVDGFDLASAGEMKTALDTNMPADKVSMAGPGKTNEELSQAIAAGIVINIESEGEVLRLVDIADQQGVTPKVAIRINPDFELKSSGMKMGGGAKQFGVDAERVPVLLKQIESLGLEFVGFHIFWGSQNLNEEAIKEAHNKTFDLAVRMSEHVTTAIKQLNIGGGLGIPYFPGEQRLGLDAIGDNLSQLLLKYSQKMPEVEVITELGRFIVGEAGVYICKIIDVKESRGEKFLITDGGLHQHLAASGNFGQIIRRNYPVAIANRMAVTKMEAVNVVGRLCTPLDLLASNVELPQAERGDLVAIYQSGAYGYTASPGRFLGHPECEEIMV